MPELDFSGQNTCSAAHGLHPYAARCPPPLVRYGLRYYSKRGETVLDPMMGSGTTLVEAKLLGRHAVGYDIDPLARLITEVKCSEVADEDIARGYEAVCQHAKQRRLSRLSLPAAIRHKPFKGGPLPKDWFSPIVARDLTKLVCAIESVPMKNPVRNFFWIAFSSLILARTSVANARDIIHSRPHRFQHPQLPNVFVKFGTRIKAMRDRLREVEVERDVDDSHDSGTACARIGDARNLCGLEDRSVDLVFTSPPYATALDYPRAHFLAVAWMESALGVSFEAYLVNGTRYIGSERGRLGAEDFHLNAELGSQPVCRKILDDLVASSLRHAKLVQRYFLDMDQAIREIARVLRPRRHAIFVVCPSHIRKVPVQTDEVFNELGRKAGMQLKAKHSRTIDRRRRLLPYMDGNQLGARMSTEYVLIFERK